MYGQTPGSLTDDFDIVGTANDNYFHYVANSTGCLSWKTTTAGSTGPHNWYWSNNYVTRSGKARVFNASFLEGRADLSSTSGTPVTIDFTVIGPRNINVYLNSNSTNFASSQGTLVPGGPFTPGNHTITLDEAYKVSNFGIRFYGTGGNTNNPAYVDNFSLSAPMGCPPPPPNYVVDDFDGQTTFNYIADSIGGCVDWMNLNGQTWEPNSNLATIGNGNITLSYSGGATNGQVSTGVDISMMEDPITLSFKYNGGALNLSADKLKVYFTDNYTGISSSTWTSIANYDSPGGWTTINITVPAPYNASDKFGVKFEGFTYTNAPFYVDDFSITSQNCKAVDLAVTKSVMPTTVPQGGTTTFTIIAMATGSMDNIIICDPLPPCAKLISSMATSGTYDGSNWDIGLMSSGQKDTLTIMVKALGQPGDCENIATFTQEDDDSANNIANAIFMITPGVLPDVCLEISKTANPTKAGSGDIVTIVTTLNNKDTNEGTNVQIKDLVPAGMTLDNFTPSVGTYNPATGIWTIPSIAGNSTETLTLMLTVN